MSGKTRGVALLAVVCGAFACTEDPVGQGPAAERGVTLALNARDQHGSRHVTILDDCDPTDPAWGNTGGCVLRGGAVTEAEFGMLLTSPLSQSVVGHPAWRNEPSYLRIRSGQVVQVSNAGGRVHTFTEVAQYGGGFVPPLNIGLTQAPECVPGSPNANQLAPGEDVSLHGLSAGNHRFQCCIHPWMRALVKVE